MRALQDHFFYLSLLTTTGSLLVSTSIRFPGNSQKIFFSHLSEYFNIYSEYYPIQCKVHILVLKLARIAFKAAIKKRLKNRYNLTTFYYLLSVP